MVTKSFSFFNSDNEHLTENGDGLIIEVGKSHIALILTRSESSFVAGFELFTFAENEAPADKLFTAIGNTSDLLARSFSKVRIFINHEICMPVPAAKFSEGGVNDFMSLIFGEAGNASPQHDQLSVHPEIINVYSVQQDMADVLKQRYGNFEMRHSWSGILEMLHHKGLFSSEQLMHVQFYNTYFIVVVIKNRMLQLIQTFVYENPEDVLYYLLNISSQSGLSTTDLQVNVSGLIDPDYKLFRELTNYFKNITADKADLTRVLVNVSEYPYHYFTPFFNLAV